MNVPDSLRHFFVSLHRQFPAMSTAVTAGTLLLFSWVSVASPTPQQEQKAPLEKPAEQVYKNIQVFKGLPNSQLLSAMFFMEGSLQVSCGHCHVWEDFSKDDKSAKLTARKMILMVWQLNETHFQGRQEISCNTCHRGQTPPAGQLPFAEIDASPKGSRSQAASAPLPTAEQLFARDLQAAGGKDAMENIHSRVMTGTRFSSEGWSSPVEIDQEAPNKLRDSFKPVQDQFVNVFDGTHGWNQDDQGVHDAESEDLAKLKQDAEFYRDLKLSQIFADARTTSKEKINGKDSYVVEARSAEGERMQLYFDAGTGLLIRTLGFDPSPFGPIPNAVDYADYREVDGIQVPFTISHLRPDYSLMDKFTEIKQNAPIASHTFDKPTMPKKP